MLADPGADRHTDHGGHGDAEHHPADCPAAAVRAAPSTPRPARPDRSRRRAGIPDRNRAPVELRVVLGQRARGVCHAKAAIRATMSARRGSRAPKIAITGTPTTTPRAYAEMTWPACGIETPTPRPPSRAAGPWSRTPWCRWRTHPRPVPAWPRPPGAPTAPVDDGVAVSRAAVAVVVTLRPRPCNTHLFPWVHVAVATSFAGQRNAASASLNVFDGRITAAAFSSSGR